MMQITVKRNILSASGAPSGLRLFLFCRPGSAGAATAFRFSPAPAQALLPFRFCPIFFPDRPICFFPAPSPTASSFGFQGLRFQSFDGIITAFCQPAAKNIFPAVERFVLCPEAKRWGFHMPHRAAAAFAAPFFVRPHRPSRQNRRPLRHDRCLRQRERPF